MMMNVYTDVFVHKCAQGATHNMPRDEEHGRHKIMDLLRTFIIWHEYDFLKWHGYDFPNEATMIS
jgi:hypothetical protein